MDGIWTTPGDHLLDRIFRTRTHLRLVRAAVAHDGTQNLTGRDLARRAGVPNSSAIRVLPELEATGILEVRRAGDYRMYDLRRDHVLTQSLEALFDDELHVDQAMVAFIRRDARHQGYVVQVAFRRSDKGEAFVTLNGRGLEDPLAGIWMGELVQRVEDAFGELVDITVRSGTASRWSRRIAAPSPGAAPGAPPTPGRSR